MRPKSLATKTYRTILALAGAAMLACLPVAAEASPVYLDIQSYNVGTTDGITFDGDAQAWSLIGGSLGDNISNGHFSLTATGLTITGDTPGYSSPLLTGTSIHLITGDSNVGIYEFSFITSGGTLSSLIPTGAVGRISIAEADDYNSGSADTTAPAPVPEPATMSLLLVGGSALVGLRRRRAASAE